MENKIFYANGIQANISNDEVFIRFITQAPKYTPNENSKGAEQEILDTCVVYMPVSFAVPLRNLLDEMIKEQNSDGK